MAFNFATQLSVNGYINKPVNFSIAEFLNAHFQLVSILFMFRATIYYSDLQPNIPTLQSMQ